MKKLLNPLYLPVILAAIYSCNPDPSFLVTGDITGAEGKMIYLQTRNDGKWLKQDSAIITDDFFQFDGRVNYPSVYYLRIDGKRGYRMFLLENSDIIVTGSADTLYNLKVAGSLANDDYETYSREIEKLFDLSSELFDQQHMAIAEGDSSAAARIGEERVALQQSIIDSQVEFVLNNPASYATPVVMRSMIVSLDAGELRDLVQTLDANLLRTDIIKSLTGTIEKMEKLSPGNPAPEFTQTDNDGNIVSLSQFIGEGPVLIYFWASWCSACRSLNPSLVNLSENYSGKGLKIIAISLDSSKDDWDNAITEDNLDWIHLSDLEFWNNEVAVLYNINEIPSGYLIDSNGIIIGNSIDITRLEELLSIPRGE